MKPRRAVTLVELLVVLVLLGLVAGVVGLTIHTARPPVQTDPVVAEVQAARDSAIRSGRSVTITLQVDRAEQEATAEPDGQVRSDTALDIDPLTGEHHAAP
ncbi:MAG TPA: prepilin-type N-terminal cleavage/methylation domain-containing protein [Gemmatimonadaceae bacterium]|nr:prepilin-type N-terminal cleavage/methylation domain-containing protein [Gemmatimonadaceae bacterium]